MSEGTEVVSSGGDGGRLHFLRPSGAKIGFTLLIFVGIAVVLVVTSFMIQTQCSGASSFCWGPGLYVLVPLLYAAEYLGGWPWGVINVSALVLAGIYCVVCFGSMRPAQSSA